MPQYDIDSGIANTLNNTTNSFSLTEVWLIVSLILAVIGGIFLYNTYFTKDKEKEYTGIIKIIYDLLNFNITIIEPIFRVLYLISAIAITLSSFAYITVNFFTFIGILIFGNIFARLGFELLLLILRLFKDVSDINKKIKESKK